MAHSPSPGPSSLSNPLLTASRLSATPPLSHQPLSKRDKRRSNIEHRLKDISTSFTTNRDFHLRNQLASITRDIIYIASANPYENAPLDDGADDLSANASLVMSTASSTVDDRLPLGKFALQFVNDVNDAMEDKDANLTGLHVSHRFL